MASHLAVPRNSQVQGSFLLPGDIILVSREGKKIPKPLVLLALGYTGVCVCVRVQVCVCVCVCVYGHAHKQLGVCQSDPLI